MKKSVSILAFCLAALLALTLAACGGGGEGSSSQGASVSGSGGQADPEPPVQTDPEAPAEHEHTWTVDTKASIAPTCGAAGLTAYVCSDCGETMTETAPATGEHVFGSNDVCDVCGYIDMSAFATPEEAIAAHGFYHNDADGSKTYTVGDTVTFGSYPQQLVEDESILASLAAYAPNASLSGWTSYGYYAEGEPSDYMFYRDVEVDGTRYRGVYLQAYRPYYFDLTADAGYSYIDDQGFQLETAYWFAFAPITWDVLGYEDGRILLSAGACLEGQPYQAVYAGSDADTIATLEGKNLNDWESSTIRAFLNGDFYDWAFTAAEKALIPTVTLDNQNSGAKGNEYQTSQNDTEDKVFLLSYQDLRNEDYGFLATSKARSRTYTPYATIQGMRPSTEGTTESGEPSCYYMLRSAGSLSYTIAGVSKQGTPGYEAQPFSLGDGESHDGFAANGDFGVLPALYLKVGPVEWEEHTITYTHHTGEEATLTYALCFPKSYSDSGEPLPLITYIPDATYRAQSIAKVEAGEMPRHWVTEEMLEKYPAVYLVLTLTKYSYTDSAAGDYLDGLADEGSEEYQVVKLLDELCEQYNLDTSRLYLTGQSMGGIFDWALNYTYPDKFAATVYVACQPGGEVSTPEEPVEMYDTIMQAGLFANQRFVYIASRLDPKSSVGQDDAEGVLQARSASYSQLYTLDPADMEGNSEALRELFASGQPRYLVGFPQVADGGMQEHMASFDLCYQIEALLEWLLAQ